jgi:hypothetical protein
MGNQAHTLSKYGRYHKDSGSYISREQDSYFKSYRKRVPRHVTRRPENIASWSHSESLYQIKEKIKAIVKDAENYKLKTIKIQLEDKIITELPVELFELASAIEKSKYILTYEDNWDGEGSVGYKRATWLRAISFLSEYFKNIYETLGRTIIPPKIYHGEGGNIDLLWETTKYRLLIEIPENPEQVATFYGDDYHKEKIEGEFEPSEIKPGLLFCLCNL